MDISKLKGIFALIRVSQWIKNVFVLAPLFFTPLDVNAESVYVSFLGFLCFCALSSAVYIMNDYMDRKTDRLHPTKKLRPIAAGTVSPYTALLLFSTMLSLSLVGAFYLSTAFALVCIVYFVQNLFYSLYLKNFPIIDILLISFGFILRIVAGAVLINVTPSVWILICSGLLAFFLAIAKRRDDIVSGIDTTHRKSLQGYTLKYIDTCMMIVLSALFVCYTIYTTDVNVMKRLNTTHLYLTVPFVFAGILRYLQITIVEQRSSSPTKIIYTDSFLFITILCWAVTNGILIYF